MKLDIDCSANRDLEENEIGIIIDSREHAIIRVLNGIQKVDEKNKIWYKVSSLPSGWGDFVIIEKNNNKINILHLIERKTVEDLKNSITDKERKSQFESLVLTANQEGAKSHIILEISSKDRFFRLPTAVARR